MGSRQSASRWECESDTSWSPASIVTQTVQRQSTTPDAGQSGASRSQDTQLFDVDITSRRQLNELQRLEQTHGSKVYDWLDEGMPRKAMGTPSDMHAFRKQKGTSVPWNAEAHNPQSIQQRTKSAADTPPAGETQVHTGASAASEFGIQRLDDRDDAQMPAELPTDLPLVAEGRQRLLNGYDVTEATESGTKQRGIPGAIPQYGDSCHFGTLQAALAAMGRDSTPLVNVMWNYPPTEFLTGPLKERLVSSNDTIDQIIELEQDPDAQQYVRNMLSQELRTDGEKNICRSISGLLKMDFDSETRSTTVKQSNNRAYQRFLSWVNDLSQLKKWSEDGGGSVDPFARKQPKELSVALMELYKSKKRKYGRQLTGAEQNTDADLKAGELLLKRNIRTGQTVGESDCITPSDSMTDLKAQFMRIVSNWSTPFRLCIPDLEPSYDPAKPYKRVGRHAVVCTSIRRENNDIILDIRDSNDPLGKTTPTPITEILSPIHTETINTEILGGPARLQDWIQVERIDWDSELLDGLSRPVDLSQFQPTHRLDRDLYPSMLAALAVSTFDRSQAEFSKASGMIERRSQELTQLSWLTQIRTPSQKPALEHGLEQAKTQRRHAEDGRKTAVQLATEAVRLATQRATEMEHVAARAVSPDGSRDPATDRKWSLQTGIALSTSQKRVEQATQLVGQLVKNIK